MSNKPKPQHLVQLRGIAPKSVLNPWGLGGYTLNPYAGCTVGCAYCYVPHMRHMQQEERKWGSYVDIKEGAVELLDRQLARLRKPTSVFMSTATDPYQPVEEHYQITRRMLKVFERYPQHALFILTKQALVERDAEILGRLPRVAVGMSISVIDDRLAGLIEPWAPLTSERLAIIERLSGRGIPTYILWAPVIVPIRLSGEWIEKSLATIARSGTGALSLDTLNYRSGQPAGLFRRLKREGHAAATKAQIEQLRNAADAQGLGRRLEVVKPAAVEETTPLLPF